MSVSYTVKPGETLAIVASHWPGNKWVSSTSIAKLNNLSFPYTLVAGQKLLIPTSEVPGASGAGSAIDGGLVANIMAGILLYGLFKVLMKIF